ncbi:MAG TPA: DUF2721 domain-containing protein [bacterium]
MDITLATPALLLPAVSLLLLVYANRFLAVAKVIRELHDVYATRPERNVAEQIRALRRRVLLIRNMQALAIASLFMCVLCMFVLFEGRMGIAKGLFAFSLLLLLGSLALAFREIQISVAALQLHLHDLDRPPPA